MLFAVRPGGEIKVGQIGTRTKPSPRAGQHQRTDVGVGLCLVERDPQLLVHLPREAVQRLRAVQGDMGHCACGGVKDGGVCHGCVSGVAGVL